jgi:hypothetical protein
MTIGLPKFFPVVNGIVGGFPCRIGLVSLTREFDCEASARLFFSSLEGFVDTIRIPLDRKPDKSLD